MRPNTYLYLMRVQIKNEKGTVFSSCPRRVKKKNDRERKSRHGTAYNKHVFLRNKCSVVAAMLSFWSGLCVTSSIPPLSKSTSRDVHLIHSHSTHGISWSGLFVLYYIAFFQRTLSIKSVSSIQISKREIKKLAKNVHIVDEVCCVEREKKIDETVSAKTKRNETKRKKGGMSR